MEFYEEQKQAWKWLSFKREPSFSRIVVKFFVVKMILKWKIYFKCHNHQYAMTLSICQKTYTKLVIATYCGVWFEYDKVTDMYVQFLGTWHFMVLMAFFNRTLYVQCKIIVTPLSVCLQLHLATDQTFQMRDISFLNF